MKLVAGALNNVSLDSLHRQHTPQAIEILVAVAYADNLFREFLELTASKNVRLRFFGRYDTSLPVALPVVEWFLDNKWRKTVTGSLVPDFYHPKVIWWKGRGAYVGSANLSQRAWTQNIEVGTFFDEAELQASGMAQELETIFLEIEARAYPIDADLRAKMKALAGALGKKRAAEEAYENEFEKYRWRPKGIPLDPAEAAKGSDRNKRLVSFQRRRSAALSFMYELGVKLELDSNRPFWMPPATPVVLQVDQFLYAYGDQFPANKGRGQSEVMAANQLRNDAAVAEAIAWWAGGDYKHEQLQRQVTVVAKLVRETFDKNRVSKLTKDQFVAAFTQVHAVGERARNRSNEALGFADLKPKQPERLRRHAEMVWDTKSEGGKTVLDLLEFVLWKDGAAPIDQRIHLGARSSLYYIEQIRENTLSDILGWVRPDLVPPVNGRTYKELRMLGFELDGGERNEQEPEDDGP